MSTERTFRAALDCRYLLHVPEKISENTLLVTTLHGYSSNPEVMLRLTATWFGDHVIAALQAPSEFFLPAASTAASDTSAAAPRSEIGYCWATYRNSDSSVRLHHEMLLHVMREVQSEYGIGPAHRVLMGFSQPVGMNYRFAATHPDAVRGVIGVCGGVPKNWDEGPYGKVSAALLHIARREDEIYPPEATARYEHRLRQRAADVEFHLLDGGHRFPSLARPMVDRWIDRVFHQGMQPTPENPLP